MSMFTLPTATRRSTLTKDERDTLTYRRIGFALMLLSTVVALTLYAVAISAIIDWLE